MTKARELADVIGTQSTTENVLQGRRNLIINGAMQVWQRGTSRTGINTAPFVADRFWSYAEISTGSIERSTDVPSGEGFVYSYYNNTNVGAPSGTNVELNVQGNASPFYNGQTLTFSFWVKAPSASSGNPLYINWRNSHANGSSSTSAAAAGSFNWTTSWSRQVMTFTLYSNPVASNRVLDFEFNIPSGAKITGVQLEVGSVATPFEHRSYGEELALCQRYFYDTRDLNQSTNGSNNYMELQGTRHKFADVIGYRSQTFTHPVVMRTNPTITAYNPNNSMTSGQVQLYAADGSTQNIGPGIFVKKYAMYFWNYTGVTVGNTGQSVVCNVHWTADAEL
jgi:hypothetical protein